MDSYNNNFMQCRICKNEEFINVMSLGEQYDSNFFPNSLDTLPAKSSVDFLMCNQCYFVQCNLPVSSFDAKDYGYAYGMSNTIVSYLQDLKNEIIQNIKFFDDYDTVFDIGSNDATFLRSFDKTVWKIGVEPSGDIFYSSYNDGGVELITDMFTYQNIKNRYGSFNCNIITTISMLEKVSDPIQFARDINQTLNDDGIWVCEQNCLYSILTSGNPDAIFYRDMGYMSLHQIYMISQAAGFNIINVTYNDFKGGSFRIYMAKYNCPVYQMDIDFINGLLNKENELPIQTKNAFTLFMFTLDSKIHMLKSFISQIRGNNQKIYIYGATTNGNTVLQYGNIGPQYIPYVVDGDIQKIGKMTSTGIPIVAEQLVFNDKPDYLLVLSSVYRNDMITKWSSYLENGGKLVFPFPEIEIVGL